MSTSVRSLPRIVRKIRCGAQASFASACPQDIRLASRDLDAAVAFVGEPQIRVLRPGFMRGHKHPPSPKVCRLGKPRRKSDGNRHGHDQQQQHFSQPGMIDRGRAKSTSDKRFVPPANRDRPSRRRLRIGAIEQAWAIRSPMRRGRPDRHCPCRRHSGRSLRRAPRAPAASKSGRNPPHEFDARINSRTPPPTRSAPVTPRRNVWSAQNVNRASNTASANTIADPSIKSQSRTRRRTCASRATSCRCISRVGGRLVERGCVEGGQCCNLGGMHVAWAVKPAASGLDCP